MSDTPETDALVPQFLNGGEVPDIFAHCRKLEKERDEAREHLQEIKEYGTEDINAAVELRQKLAQALVDSDNMQDQRDLAMKVIKRLEQERDEAITRRMETIMQCELYEQERDDVREVFREMWQSGDAFLPYVDEKTTNRWRKAAGWEETK